MADRTRRNAFINENIGEQMNSADREAGSIEQMLTGRYLVAWSDAKVFKDPATASENAVGQIARDLCAGPKLRSVEIRSKNGQITIVDSEVPAVKPHIVDIAEQWRPTIFSILVEMLCRLPCAPKELPSDDMAWLIALATRVADMHESSA